MAGDIVVRFVRQQSARGEILEKTFKETSAHEYTTQWMTEEECLKITERIRKSIFIFDKFEGAAFENIIKTGNRIYGPSVILSSIKDEQAPPRMTHPVHNMSMNNFVVSCTSLEVSGREAVHRHIQWMCGEVSKDFHDKVTHLVAGEVGSKKYLVAASLNKRIMTPEWVQQVWEDSQTKFCNPDSEAYNQFRCKVFTGCVITVSGLDNDERKEVKNIVEDEGGKYTGEMKIHECTHLIINSPKGAKYEFAKKWKIPIVRPAWLFDCVDAGYCIETQKYKLITNEVHERPNALTSTPNAANASHMNNNPDVSCISVGQINETAMNQTIQRPPETAPLDNLDVSKVKSGMFVDGCKIFLSGFRGPRLEKLRKLINMGGGTRFSQINESVSHVIQGDHVEEHVKLLREGRFRLQIVSAAWIVSCAECQTQVPEDLYVCLELPGMEPLTPTASKISKPSKATVTEPARAEPVDPDRTVGPDDMQDLLSQYLPVNKDTTDESALMRAVQDAEQHQKPQDDTDMTQDPTQETQNGGVFAGKKLAIIGMSAEENQELSALIEEADGIIVGMKSRTVPDFAVVPLFGFEVPITASEIVTNAYVQMCLDSEELLPVEDNPMFTPVTCRAENEPLAGCVLSISGYSGVERDVLMHIAEELGATCQEHFVRHKKTKHLGNTHLVVNVPSGDKYKAAKKWNLPAIDRTWLYKCARTGKRVSEEHHLVDRVHEENTTLTDEPTLPPEPAAPPVEPISLSKTLPVEPKTLVKAAPKAVSEPQPSTSKSSTDHQPATSLNKENVFISPQVLRSFAASVSSLTPEVRKDLMKELKDSPLLQNAENFEAAEKAGIDSPSKFLTRGVTFVPKYNFTKFLAALDTPEEVRKKRHARNDSDNLSMAELFRKHMAIALENAANPQNWMPNTPARTRDDPLEKSIFHEGPGGPLRGVIIVVSKKLSGQQSDINNMAAELGADYRWSYDQSCTHFVFQGRRNDTSKEFRTAREDKKIIVSPHWITMCKEQNARVDESLFPHDYNPHLSLAVMSATKDTPSRLSTRRATRSRLNKDETGSPSLSRAKRGSASTKPAEEIDLTTDSTQLNKAHSPRKRKLEIKDIDESGDGATSAHDKSHSSDEVTEQNPKKALMTPYTQPANTLAREAFVDDITNIMAATKTYSKGKRGSRRTDSLSGETTGEPDAKMISLSRSSNKSEDSDTPRSSSKEQRQTRRSLRSRTGKKTDLTEPSQMVEVTWDDPQTRQQQEKLAAELAKNSESLSPRPVMLTSDEDENAQKPEDDPPNTSTTTPAKDTTRITSPHSNKSPAAQPDDVERIKTPEPPSLAMPTRNLADDQENKVDLDETTDEQKPPPVFLFTGVSQQERADYGALVEQLGGRVSDAPNYDKACTHLVVARPTRNEKYLACVAAGKWVLHKSYLEVCRQQQSFVDEEAHEWGSQATEAILDGQPAVITKLANAAHRWRRQVVEGAGAFSDWTCVLLADKKKEDGLVRLLLAGGATVRSTRPPFTNLEDLNFAFMDLGKVKEKVDVNEFLAAGVHCVRPDYIMSYLTDDPLPKPRQYYIPEVTGGTSESSRKRKPSGTDTPNSKRPRNQ